MMMISRLMNQMVKGEMCNNIVLVLGLNTNASVHDWGRANESEKKKKTFIATNTLIEQIRPSHVCFLGLDSTVVAELSLSSSIQTMWGIVKADSRKGASDLEVKPPPN